MKKNVLIMLCITVLATAPACIRQKNSTNGVVTRTSTKTVQAKPVATQRGARTQTTTKTKQTAKVNGNEYSKTRREVREVK